MRKTTILFLAMVLALGLAFVQPAAAVSYLFTDDFQNETEIVNATQNVGGNANPVINSGEAGGSWFVPYEWVGGVIDQTVIQVRNDDIATYPNTPVTGDEVYLKNSTFDWGSVAYNAWSIPYAPSSTYPNLVKLTQKVWMSSGIVGTYDWGGAYDWGDAMKISAYDVSPEYHSQPWDSPLDFPLWDLYVDVNGEIRWYDGGEPTDVWGMTQKLNLDAWNTIEIVADTGNATFTMAINGTESLPAADIYGWGVHPSEPVPSTFSWFSGGGEVDMFHTSPAPYYLENLDDDDNYEIFLDDVVFTLPLTPGDTDGDEDVDIDDLNTVKANWGTSVPVDYPDDPSTYGDLNRDGYVSVHDFNIIRLEWPAYHGGAALSSVPEPDSLAMLAMGSFLLLVLQRRNRV